MPNTLIQAIKRYLIDKKIAMKTNETCKTVWLKMLATLSDKSIKFYHLKVHCQDCSFKVLDIIQWSQRNYSTLNTCHVTTFSMLREFWEWKIFIGIMYESQMEV